MTSAMFGKLVFILIFLFLLSTSSGIPDDLVSEIRDIKEQLTQHGKDLSLLKKQVKFLLDFVAGQGTPAPSSGPNAGSISCDLDIQAYSGYTLSPTQHDCPVTNIEGFVKVNGLQVWSGGFCHPNISNSRGIHLLILDPFACRVGNLDFRQYDTHGDRSASTRLADYLTSLPEGTVIIGVSGDEVTNYLYSEGRRALRNLGADIDLLGYRGNFGFVAQKGHAHKTVIKQQIRNLPSTLTSRLRVRVSGDSVESVNFQEIPSSP